MFLQDAWAMAPIGIWGRSFLRAWFSGGAVFGSHFDPSCMARHDGCSTPKSQFGDVKKPLMFTWDPV